MTKPIHLTEWALPAHAYTAPEAAIFVAVGKRYGKMVRTSQIVEVIGTRTFRTMSGSVYILDGEPNKANAADPKKPLNWCKICLDAQAMTPKS